MKKLFFLPTIFLSLIIIVNSCSDSGTESTPIYTLSVMADPAEGGMVSPSSGEYERGEGVEVSATPNDGWMFDGWQGDQSGNSNPVTVTMSSDKQISARFVERTYPLTINTKGEGTVQESVISQKTTEYKEGTIVELTAEPAEGWRFVEWKGDIEGAENPATIGVDSEKSVTAVFERRDYPLTVRIEGEGTVAEEVIQTKTTDYPYETKVQLTAIPSEGWVFARWEGDVAGTENPATVEVSDEKTVTAVFERDTFKISYTLNGEGQVTETLTTGTQAEDGSYEFESTVELTAVPAEGWQFTGWGGNVQGTDNPQTISVDFDKSVTANFERKDYPLTVNIEGEGTVEERIISQPKTTDYPYETVIELTPNPSEGWKFIEWSGNLSGNENPKQITIDGEKNVTVTFEPIAFLGDNGVTIMCPNGRVGNIGVVDSVEYEVVDRELLEQRRDEGSDLTKVCTSQVTNMRRLFYQSIFDQSINNWDVSSVTNMSSMFYESYFNSYIGDWDVSSVTDMSFMFNRTPYFNQNINDWDVGSVTQMGGMFVYSNFNQPLGDWDVSSVTDMNRMFLGTPFNQPIGSWDVSNVTDMNNMFFESEFNHPIGDWDVSNVTEIISMFGGTPFNQDISNWDISSVRDLSNMFSGSDFNKPIGNWNVSNISKMNTLFSGSKFNQPIGDWDVGKVTEMLSMFSDSQFNHPIGKWDVSNVRNMNYMFSYSNFNQAIDKWCVIHIENEPFRFADDSPLTEENKPLWGTCPE